MKKHDNPFEPSYVEGSPYDPLKDKSREAAEYMFNQMSEEEKKEFNRDLKDFNKDLNMFKTEK